MKKFLIVLLSLGLIAAFSMTASAADVKFSGSYYVVGVYDNNDSLRDTSNTNSRAFFYQRVRLQPVFQIAEGLTFTARMDALEKQWGQTNWKGGFEDVTLSRKLTSVTADPPRGIQESFEFERGYVTFQTAIGQFQVGYQAANTWGTAFADSGTTRPRIFYMTAVGPLTLLAIYEKWFETDSASNTGFVGPVATTYKGKAAADNNVYFLAGIYGFPGGSAGLLYVFGDIASSRIGTAATPTDMGYRTKMHVLAPMVKATFGPVYVESEVLYTFGKAAEFDAGGQDVDFNGWAAYLMAKTNLGPAYVGAQVGWSAGDNNAADNKDSTGLGGGSDWNPALILLNDDLNTWASGTLATGNWKQHVSRVLPAGTTFVSISGPPANDKKNTMIYNIFAGFNPMPKLNVEASLTVAAVDKKDVVLTTKTAGVETKRSASFDSKNLGTEFDLKATYKLYDNLSYMVGAGYLWTGDYFKGPAGSGIQVDNDYMLMNKLTLSF